MMPLETVPFDAAAFLDSPEAQAEYLSLSMQENDPAEIAHALGVVARARGMSAVARDAGLGRESLYKSLSESGNPEFATVLKVIQSLGMKLAVLPA
jgi:probable addiction module antidote protein